jgi:transcriptional regulator with XRE-family HTH domain
MSDEVRLYLRDLRIKQGFSQEKVSENIGWSLRSFSDWETGKSGDIKSRYLIRLVVFLCASWEEIVRLELTEITEQEDGTPHQIARPPPDQFHSDELEKLIHQLRVDEELQTAFLIFWAGWNARSP